MYIVPNSKLLILRGVPFDNTYQNTVYFDTPTAQAEYFLTLAKYTYSEMSYQRVNRGIIRIQANAEDLYDCNYLMFQNTSFGTRWFYAFVTSIDYVNNSVAEVRYQMDVLQTWHFNYTLAECFVVRQHTETDNLFENLVEENLQLGDEYVCNQVEDYSLGYLAICMQSTADTLGNTPDGMVENNVYTPLLRTTANIESYTAINDDLKQIVQQVGDGAIVSIYEYPRDIEKTEETSFDMNMSLNGYTPKNRKLLSYPYNYLYVSNNCGVATPYRWEDWGGNARFLYQGTKSPYPMAHLIPIYYKGMEFDYDESVVMNDFMQCAWSTDTGVSWWAQNKGSITTGLVASALGGASGATQVANSASASLANSAYPVFNGTGMSYQAPIEVQRNAYVAQQNQGIGAITDIAGYTLSTLGKMYDISNLPPTIHNNVGGSPLQVIENRYKFTLYKMSIKAQFAKIIDEYFTRFGYAVHSIRTPNRTARPHFTFVKTIGCELIGSIPSDDYKQICHIYDNGITWWRNPAEVGQYNTVDNRV